MLHTLLRTYIVNIVGYFCFFDATICLMDKKTKYKHIGFIFRYYIDTFNCKKNVFWKIKYRIILQ